MFDYLDKFNNLKSDLKASVSDPDALKIIEDLEGEYNIELASLIMRVMVKDVSIEMLPLTLFTEFRLGQEKSEKLAKDLEVKIFSRVGDYLGILPLVDIPVVDVSKKSEVPANLESVMEEVVVRDKTSPVAVEIIRSLNIKFKDEEKRTKFLVLLDKYLRGIKDRFSARQIFTANLASGGFGLTDKMVDSIFIMAQEIEKGEYEKAKKGLRVENDILAKINKLSHGNISDDHEARSINKKKAPELLAPLVPAIIPESEFPMIIENVPEKVKEKLAEIKNDFDKIENFSQVKEEKGSLKKEDNSISTDDKKETLESKKPPEIITPVEIAPKIRPMTGKVDIKPDSSGKIKIDDVRRVKTTGPIDEIKYMDLTNFHRLSESPDEAFQKIKKKLEVLENIDYGKMLEGIKAWRQSPVYRLYLKIFSKASEERISVDRVIENLKNSKQEYLSREEINALIRFNKSLAF
jgi:hypothetical protein